MVGYTQNPIKSFCMSLYTNKYYLTYLFGSREKESSKMYERGGTGSPLLRIHFENMWSWLDLVGYAKFRSFALVVCHRLQQRKLIPAKMKNKTKTKTQSKHRIAKSNPQDSPYKTTKTKNTKTANNINQNLEFDKFWLFCVFRVCFFLCALVLYVLDPVFFMLIGSFGSTSEGCGQKRLSEKRRPANQSCFFSVQQLGCLEKTRKV